jgi:hypothetical protein
VNTQALPLDALYEPTDQVYGLPSFPYAGMIVSYFWRYNCPEFPCFKGGFVSAALGFSYNSRNWTAFGQFPLDHKIDRSSRGGNAGANSKPAVDVGANTDGEDRANIDDERSSTISPPILPRGPLMNMDVGKNSGLAYNHTFKVYTNKTAGAFGCQAECDADAKCAAWTYVRAHF